MLKTFKYLIMLAGILNFCYAYSLAAQTGGTSPVVDGSLVVLGGEYDYILDRTLKSSDIKNGKISEESTFYAKLTFKIADFLSVYTKAGMSNLKTEMDIPNGSKLKEDYDFGFYGGAGAKISYQLMPRLRAALDNQLNFWKCDIRDVDYLSWHITSQTGHISIWEYQLAGILSYTIDHNKLISPAQGEFPKLTPYLGLKYAYLKMDSNVTAIGDGISVTAPHIRKNDDNVGIIFGLDITFDSLSGFAFNIEGRFLDETAISGYLNYSF